MTDKSMPEKAIPDVRELALLGILATYFQEASHEERRLLRIAAYELVYPVVFQGLTRRLERRRGHHHCARSVHNLRPECLDRFHDDVDGMLDFLFRRANGPIGNLEGWLSRCLPAGTAEAHRRRRGQRGALQRPRLTGWLTAALDYEPRLMSLAVEMLVWVGVEATAGGQPWPIDAWADMRCMQTGDYEGARRAVAHDVERVLAAMRQRPAWYERYVERPLGRKQAPLPLAPWTSPDPAQDSACPGRTRCYEAEETRLKERAATAVTIIQDRLARSEDPRAVVVEVLTTVFDPGTGAEELDRCPGSGPDAEDLVATLLADPVTIDRVVSAVRDLSSLAC
jgi:hypothetical protein